MRPTKVRAMVGSRMSGSSARPMRRVCAWTVEARRAATRKTRFMVNLLGSERCLKPGQSLIDGSQLRGRGERLELAPEVAGHPVLQHRLLGAAKRLRVRTARAEAAARGRVVGARDVALKD